VIKKSMTIKFALVLFALIPTLCFGQTDNYLDYHNKIIRAEEYIVAKQFNEAIVVFRNLTDTYEHVFLRDIKVAAQLAAYVNDTDNLFYFLEKGMKKGWTEKEIMKIEHLRKFKNDDRWRKLKAERGNLKKEFENSINLELRNEVRTMFSEDQKKALIVALTPVKKWRERYTNRKFVPQNRSQVRRINKIIDHAGYPGEKIIGDRSWATVIISHNEHDTIYNELSPKLYEALRRGELSAIDLAIIETWRTVVDTDRKEKGFVIWNETINSSEAMKADSLRQTIGLRSIELNNKLLHTAKELKMEFFLSPFHGGIITVRD
jgi:hypothetical protein